MSAITDRAFNPSGSSQIDKLKAAALEFEAVIRENTPAGRRQSIALTNLETASMFAVKAAAVGDD